MKLLTNEQQKMQKFVIFVKKNLTINMPKIKKLTGEYRDAAHSISNLI